MTRPTLTTTAGAPVADNQNSHHRRPARAGADAGLSTARKARAPEPRAHPRARRSCQRLGRVRHVHRHQRYHAIHQGAQSLQVRQEDGVLAPFSTVAGERGAADAERDVRGFALKFYTEEGNWDLVGNNTPVFFIRDPLKVPRLHSHAEAPPEDQPALAHGHVGFLVAVAGNPASGHDPDVRPRPARSAAVHMNGYGSHTYQLHQRQERTVLGEVPLQDDAGHPAL